jgi:uncharacterized membrane protein
MSGNPPSDHPQPESQPPQQPEGARSGTPQPPPQSRPPQVPPQASAHLLPGGFMPAPGLGVGLGVGVGAPMPVFLPMPAGQLSQVQQTVQLWQGQYPPPEAIEHYEKVLPGSFDRMIAMAERLQAAQIEESRRAHDYTHSDNQRGHWLGFSAAVIAIAALAFNDPWVAVAFISVPVMGVARALIESARKSSPAELLATAAASQPSQQTPSAASPAPPPPAPQPVS